MLQFADADDWDDEFMDWTDLRDWIEPELPNEPTGTLVGTVERIAVYRLRLERGDGLYHPLDSEVVYPADREHWPSPPAKLMATMPLVVGHH